MKLDSSFFDSISLTLIDGKYFSAQEVYQLLKKIRSFAKEDAADMEKLQKKLDRMEENQIASVGRVQEMISSFKAQQEIMNSTLNSQWQSYLSGLSYFDGEQPEDLSDKVGRIASVVQEISEPEKGSSLPD